MDGTLIRSIGDDSNKLHKDAFKAAFLDVFELDTHIDKLKHHGGTDPLILMKVLMVCHNIPKEKCMERLEDMKAAMCAHYEANKSRSTTSLCVTIFASASLCTPCLRRISREPRVGNMHAYSTRRLLRVFVGLVVLWCISVRFGGRMGVICIRLRYSRICMHEFLGLNHS